MNKDIMIGRRWVDYQILKIRHLTYKSKPQTIAEVEQFVKDVRAECNTITAELRYLQQQPELNITKETKDA